MVIRAHDIVSVDTISKGNDKPWAKIMDYMDKNDTGEMMEFDFRGVEVVQPSGSPNFVKLLRRPNFSMVIYNNELVSNSIRIMCTLNGVDDSRIKSVKDIPQKVITPAEKRMFNIANGLYQYFVVNDSKTQAVINIYDRFTQIQDESTITAIGIAIRKFHDDTGIKDMVLYTKKAIIHTSVMPMLLKLIDDLEAEGVSVTVRSDDRSVMDKLSLHKGTANREYSDEERLSIMKTRLCKNKVGLLTRYAEGTHKDEFGRYGQGKILSVRAAIFKGFTENKGQVGLMIRSFNEKRLYTHDHWYLEHDGDELNELDYDDQFILPSEIGIYNDFIGLRFHFSTAVQFSKGGEVTMYSVSDSGGAVGTKLTIPERIKTVFDDFGVEYEPESLEAYILETKRILETCE